MNHFAKQSSDSSLYDTLSDVEIVSRIKTEKDSHKIAEYLQGLTRSHFNFLASSFPDATTILELANAIHALDEYKRDDALELLGKKLKTELLEEDVRHKGLKKNKQIVEPMMAAVAANKMRIKNETKIADGIATLQAGSQAMPLVAFFAPPPPSQAISNTGFSILSSTVIVEAVSPTVRLAATQVFPLVADVASPYPPVDTVMVSTSSISSTTSLVSRASGVSLAVSQTTPSITAVSQTTTSIATLTSDIVMSSNAQSASTLVIGPVISATEKVSHPVNTSVSASSDIVMTNAISFIAPPTVSSKKSSLSDKIMEPSKTSSLVKISRDSKEKPVATTTSSSLSLSSSSSAPSSDSSSSASTKINKTSKKRKVKEITGVEKRERTVYVYFYLLQHFKAFDFSDDIVITPSLLEGSIRRDGSIPSGSKVTFAPLVEGSMILIDQLAQMPLARSLIVLCTVAT